jgi:AcrR family transcriptional regulator
MRGDDADFQKLKAINTIGDYLDDLRQSRPSVRLAAGRSRKGAETIRDILKSARAIFIAEGHGGLTMRKVAAASGLAVGNVSYYFKAKRDLVEATLREELADYVEEHIRQFEAGRDSPLEILLNVLGFYVSNARQSHRFFYQMWGFAASDPEAKALIRSLYRPIGRFIYHLVKSARPSLDDLAIRQIVLQLFSLEEGMKLFIGMGPDDDRALATAERDLKALARRIIETQ